MTEISNYLPALAGGVLIGVASVLLLLFNGRIAGVSGILNGVVRPRAGDWAWRLLFLLGLILGAGAFLWFNPEWSAPRPVAATFATAVAGFLVGFGTRMANGCTSGHGVCGLGMLSWRSFSAVLTFMLVAMITVYVVQHLGVFHA